MFWSSLLKGGNISPKFLHQIPKLLSTTTALNEKNANIKRQGKIISKLYGERIAGSKKRWYPAHDANNTENVNFKASDFGKSASKRGGGKGTTRRMTVLNKLFMQHITDMLATGEVSEKILGRSLQVSRVKISADFALVNVYWLGSGEVQADAELEQELYRCSGLLRHELSQLELMGVVPRIKFVRDKSSINLNQLENILNKLDLNSEEQETAEGEIKHTSATRESKDCSAKLDFFGNSECTLDAQLKDVLPKMRHDVFGLNHRDISLKIHTRLRKSKQAWDLHNQEGNVAPILQESYIPKGEAPTTTVNTKEFKDFLAKRQTIKIVAERKKSHREEEFWIETPENNGDLQTLSPQQRRLYQEEDYIDEDIIKK